MAQVTGSLIVYDNTGTPKVGATIWVQMILPPPTTGVYDNTPHSYVSTIGGIVAVSGMFTGATYNIWRGRSDKMRYRIPDSATSPHLLPDILGNDSTDTCIT